MARLTVSEAKYLSFPRPNFLRNDRVSNVRHRHPPVPPPGGQSEHDCEYWLLLGILAIRYQGIPKI